MGNEGGVLGPSPRILINGDADTVGSPPEMSRPETEGFPTGVKRNGDGLEDPL